MLNVDGYDDKPWALIATGPKTTGQAFFTALHRPTMCLSDGQMLAAAGARPTDGSCDQDPDPQGYLPVNAEGRKMRCKAAERN